MITARAAPGEATPVPVDSRVMLMLLGLLIAVAAAWQVRGRMR